MPAAWSSARPGSSSAAPSGAGKSSLARELLLRRRARPAASRRLVSDDRTRLEARHGRLVACPVEPIAGRIEIRGIGIVRQPFEPAAVVRLVVDSVGRAAAPPEARTGSVSLCGVMVPRLRMRTGAISADIVLGRLSGVCDTVVTL